MSLLTEDIQEDKNGWGTALGCVVLWAPGGAWSPGLAVSLAVSHRPCPLGQLFHPEARFLTSAMCTCREDGEGDRRGTNSQELYPGNSEERNFLPRMTLRSSNELPIHLLMAKLPPANATCPAPHKGDRAQVPVTVCLASLSASRKVIESLNRWFYIQGNKVDSPGRSTET